MELRPAPRWYLRLHWQIFLAMAAGIAAGVIGGEPFANRVEWLGQLFVRLLRMVIVPLVVTSIVSGVASVGGAGLRRLFTKTMGYYLLSSALAILIGLSLTNLIRPGDGADIGGAAARELPQLSPPGSVMDILLSMVPDNLLQSAAKPDMLPLIVFCILFGVAVAGLPERPRTTLTAFFDAAFRAMMRLTGGVIRLAPIGVFGLIARVAGTSGIATFKALALYMAT
ncbi:MAG: cation:dicarboxylase symporter family transporter, partial [Gemmatimonadota bacterium]|nr:cation:dicarboxylase symporter family transporter [Gemmatimonadota bacterium]